jgi:hypothetical protein
VPSAEGGTLVSVARSGLRELEAEQHAAGWAHLLERLVTAGRGGDPRPAPLAMLT